MARRGNDGRVLSEQRLRDIAEGLTEVRGISAVALGGSRARGQHTPTSDVDMGLYYRPPLDVRALEALAKQIAGADAGVTAPGEWGPWVDGGAWLWIEGTAVDWLYRDLDRVGRSVRDAQEGRFAWHFQVGHPLGVPDFLYAGEVALVVVLVDPSGDLRALQEAAREYPPRLRDAVVSGLWEAGFCLENAHKAVSRADSAYVSGCLFRAILLCAHALHAHAGRWVVNEKGAVSAAGQLPESPSDFAGRAHAICAGGSAYGDDLGATLTAAQRLLDETMEACGYQETARRPDPPTP
jgi:Nucleotidyltransferase domain